MKRPHDSRPPRDQHVVVVGCGGNIASHLTPHLGRMPEIGRVTLIDRDRYERDNLYTQDIQASDIDKPKSVVQARRLRRIDPGLRIDAIVDAVENVPLGRMKCDVMLAGLDSRLARLVTAERARQLGVTLIDAGVDGPGLLARVSVFYPEPDSGCPQCQYQAADYEAIEQTYPCTAKGGGGFDVEAPSTNAPSGLGSLAASLAALECRRVIAEQPETEQDRRGREMVMEAGHGNLYVTRLEANPDCRFAGHRASPLDISLTRPGTATLGDVIDGLPAARSGRIADPGRLWVVGQSFATRLTCSACGDQREVLALKASMRHAGRNRCRRCGGDLVDTGFGTRDQLELGALAPRTLKRTLNSIGLRDGDVLAIGVNGSAGDAKDDYVIEVTNNRRNAARSRRQR